jgi:hypothetical protein
MCIFSQPVEHVSSTNIFARATIRGTQMLVYAMTLSAREELAMVLPLPTLPGAPENAVRFINLERYAHYFDDMRKGFPETRFAPMAFGGVASGHVPETPLVVHDVGAFEASFVPSLADFSRLDPRFALPAQTWDALPTYKDWGFAVFKLKGFGATHEPEQAPEARPRPGFLARLFGAKGDPTATTTSAATFAARAAASAARTGSTLPTTTKNIHPMAFELTPRDPGVLFFPTVHVHDGTVHEKAHFNHTLYCQVPEEVAPRLTEWHRSFRPALTFMDVHRLEETVLSIDHVHQRTLLGERPNRDQWVALR